MAAQIQYGHARNNNPAPPISIEVDGGIILSFSITEKAAATYTSQEIAALFEAAGIGPAKITIPLPEKFNREPLGAIRIRLLPGNYQVSHVGEILVLPEQAFLYWLE